MQCDGRPWPARCRGLSVHGAVLAGVLATVACGPVRTADVHRDAAQSTTLATSTARFEALHGMLADGTTQDGYLGGVTLVLQGDTVLDVQASGFADLARTRPMRRDAIFRLYSMTKPIASVAVLRLADAGRLSIDAPVSRYLPELARREVLAGDSDDGDRRPATREITLRELLTHSAGLPAGLPGDGAATRALERADLHGAADLAGVVARLRDVPLAADPGTRFGYDGAATEILARVVEVVSGQPFDAYLQEEVLGPLRMHDTGFEVPPTQRARVVDITRMDDVGDLVLDTGPSARTPGARLQAYPSAAGGLYSTADDYARFCRMLLGGGALDGVRILREDTVAAMLRNQLPFDPPVTQFSDAEGFGFGGYVVIDPAKRGYPGRVGQFGWSGAASTSFTIDPSRDVVAILLLQHLPRDDGRADLPRLARAFYTAVDAAVSP